MWTKPNPLQLWLLITAPVFSLVLLIQLVQAHAAELKQPKPLTLEDRSQLQAARVKVMTLERQANALMIALLQTEQGAQLSMVQHQMRTASTELTDRIKEISGRYAAAGFQLGPELEWQPAENPAPGLASPPAAAPKTSPSVEAPK